MWRLDKEKLLPECLELTNTGEMVVREEYPVLPQHLLRYILNIWMVLCIVKY